MRTLHSRHPGRLLAAALALAVGAGPASLAMAQAVSQVRAPSAPLVLESRGSVMIGGDRVAQSSDQLGTPYPGTRFNGHITINQMYVEFMVPVRKAGLPVIMIHGGNLTGKTWDTTPDGRMGWYEYFVRHGRPTYVADQVGRGRSGFPLAAYNEVRAGLRPPSELPNAFRIPLETNWANFRMGPAYGEAFPGQQFPVEAIDEFAKQSVPDMIGSLASPDLTPKALASLARDLGGAVIVSHSQSGPWPLEAALLAPDRVRAAVLVEPGRCPPTFTDEQVSVFARRPILMLFGDHLDNRTGMPTSWRDRHTACQALVARINAVGGTARLVYLPELGIPGNTHMIMQDRNSHRIADMVLKWLDEVVDRPVRRSRR